MSPLPFDSHRGACQLFFVSQSKELFSTSNFPVPTASFLEPYLQLDIRDRRIKTGSTLSTIKLIHELKIKIPPYNTFGEDPETFKPLIGQLVGDLHSSDPTWKQSDIPRKRWSTFSPPPPLYHKRMNSIWPSNIWPCNTYLEKAEKGREGSQMLKEPHRYSMGKHNQKNCRNGVGMSAGSRQRRLWCSTLPVSQDDSACAAPEGNGSGGGGATLRVLQNQVTCVLHS